MSKYPTFEQLFAWLTLDGGMNSPTSSTLGKDLSFVMC